MAKNDHLHEDFNQAKGDKKMTNKKQLSVSQPTLPGIKEKQKRVRRFKEDYVKECERLQLQNAQLQSQLVELERKLVRANKSLNLIGWLKGLVG